MNPTARLKGKYFQKLLVNWNRLENLVLKAEEEEEEMFLFLAQ
jgi:hypothetical protein